MKNFIINNNEAILDNNNPRNKKNKTEIQLEVLKTQAQQISEQLEAYQVKQKKVKNLMNALWVSERFGNKFLNELVESEKSLQKQDTWWLEKLIKNEVAFAFKFETGIFKKIDDKANSLSSELDSVKRELQRQDEARRQNKVLLQCDYKKSIGCLGNWQCDNCQINYSVNNSQEFREVAT